ncbi:hypothetical protein HN031_03750 [Nocardioides sp. zg-1308]|uniref:hypothetical protein n=1 Tax=Nocardioides sp. zg-1308 TaxID=2736253 RepID=UPI0015543E0B|nr:hypothetical protein [Nocardioides sp. zg-1308]NPD03798.1 hypothetical protein [Nocardioides sp. zg-1308]
MVDRSPEWVVSGLLTLFSGRHLMHVRRALAVALAVPLLLTGCSEDEPEPRMPDPPPTSTSPTDEPTQTETAEAESAEDFIRRWVKAGDEMQVTGETDEYRSLVGETCKACAGFLESVEDVYGGGGSVKFGGSTINRIAMREKKPPTYAVTKTLPETIIERDRDAEPEVLAAGRTTLLVILKRTADSWLVTYYGIL